MKLSQEEYRDLICAAAARLAVSAVKESPEQVGRDIDRLANLAERLRAASNGHPVRRALMPDDEFARTIEMQDLSTRALAICREIGAETVDALATWSERELLKRPGVGRRYVNELRALLDAHGLTFA